MKKEDETKRRGIYESERNGKDKKIDQENNIKVARTNNVTCQDLTHFTHGSLGAWHYPESWDGGLGVVNVGLGLWEGVVWEWVVSGGGGEGGNT